MPEAIFGLVGVIIGGLLTAGADHLARRAAARHARQMPARVLYDELASVTASARRSIETHRPQLVFPEKLEEATSRFYVNKLMGGESFPAPGGVVAAGARRGG